MLSYSDVKASHCERAQPTTRSRSRPHANGPKAPRRAAPKPERPIGLPGGAELTGTAPHVGYLVRAQLNCRIGQARQRGSP